MCIYVCTHLLLLYFELWSESFQSYSFNSPASREGRTSKPSSDYNTKASRLFLSLKGRAVGQERQFGNDKLGVQKGTESRLPKWLLPIVGGSSVNTSEVTDHTRKEAWNFLAALPGESMYLAWMLWGKADSIFKAGAYRRGGGTPQNQAACFSRAIPTSNARTVSSSKLYQGPRGLVRAQLNK